MGSFLSLRVNRRWILDRLRKLSMPFRCAMVYSQVENWIFLRMPQSTLAIE